MSKPYTPTANLEADNPPVTEQDLPPLPPRGQGSTSANMSFWVREYQLM